MNPLLPKTIIGRNNSSLEINWTNCVGSQNPLYNYLYWANVSDNHVIGVSSPMGTSHRTGCLGLNSGQVQMTQTAMFQL